jgi:hypothetical protein
VLGFILAVFVSFSYVLYVSALYPLCFIIHSFALSMGSSVSKCIRKNIK